MKPVTENRRDNLARLVKEHGGQVALSALIDKDRNQIGQWLMEPGATGARNIGNASARQIENALGLPVGSMDYPHDSLNGSDTATGRESTPLPALASHSQQLDADIMLVAWRWVKAFQTAEGEKWSELQRMQALADIYSEIVADGGTLSDERHDLYLQRMESSVQRRSGGDNERGKGVGSKTA